MLLLLLLVSETKSGEPAAIEYKTGERFEAELESTLSAVWQNESLRHVVQRIVELQGVSLLVDRRIDPTQNVQVEVTDRRLRDVVGEVAAGVRAGVSVVSNTVYVGPPDCSAKLRTLVELRVAELSAGKVSAPAGRRIALLGERSFTWNDLAEPRTLVERIAAQNQLTVDGLDLVPHDLWAAATLPACDAVEALSLVLIQFDLTFAWGQGASGVQIVPAPLEAAIERSYEPGRITAAAAIEKWRDAVPGLEARAENRRVVVRGTAEQHQAVNDLLHPRARRPQQNTAISDAPLSKRRFTLQRRGPASAVIAALRRSGIEIVYDEQRLAAAKLDLGQLVDIDVKNATAEQFFAALCGPLGLTFTIDERTVTLEPR